MDTVLRNWDAIKAQERAEQGLAPHPLDGGISSATGPPKKRKSRKLQSKAAKLGWLDRTVVAQNQPELVALLSPALDEQRLESSALAACRHRPPTRPKRRRRTALLHRSVSAGCRRHHFAVVQLPHY